MLHRLDPAGTLIAVTVSTEEPVAIALDPADQALWVLTRDHLQKRASHGALVLSLSLGPIGANGAQFLAVDPTDGSVWVGEGNRLGLPLFKQIVHLSRTGTVLASWASPGRMGGLSVAPDHSLWVLSDKLLFRDRLYHLSPTGTVLADKDLRPISDGEPQLLRVDNQGAWIWITARKQVVRVDADQLNAPPVTIPLAKNPEALTVDEASGRIWILADRDAMRFSEQGARERTVDLKPRTQIGGIEFEPASRTLWVIHRDGATRFDQEGSNPRLFATARKPIVIAVAPLTLHPAVTIESPANGALLNNARPTITLRLGAACGSGVCPPTPDYISGLTINAVLNGEQVGGHFVIDANAGTAAYTPPAALPEGSQSFQVTVTDAAGRVSSSASLTFRIDTVAPAFVVLSPDSPKFTNQNPIQISGRLSETATLTVGTTTVAVAPDLTFSHAFPLSEGGNTAVLEAKDAAQNNAIRSIAITLDTHAPSAPVTSGITVSPPQAGQIQVLAAAGSTEPNARIRIVNVRTGESVEVMSNAQGSFSASIGGASGDELRIVVLDAAGNSSAPANVSVPGTTPTEPPPDPATVAPPIEKTVASSVFTTTAFLYTGPNPTQTGVAPGTILPKQVAIVRGRVLARDGQPIPGVRINFPGRPQFGQTLSRTDGRFDMAVNGGGLLTLRYEKAGLLTAQRQVNTPWQDFALVEDVVLVELDTRVTTISLSSAGTQVAQGNPVVDSDGSRTATVLFPAGTAASMVLANGTEVPLTTISVRATEYTVGPNGPKAMPGSLPASSGYTYAVEFSADEAIAAGARQVRFNQAIPIYVENFLNFPVGGIVPAGWYDREKAAWVPSANGRVIKILSIQGGLAVLDTNGDGAADNAGVLAGLGITDAERAQLASLYVAGQTLWRVPVTHFTPWDCNWPYGPPNDATPPKEPAPEPEKKDDKPCENNGSVIECQNRILGERVAIAGTGLSLNYRSNRVPGYKPNRLKIPLTGASVPPGVTRVELEVTIGGKQLLLAFPPAPNLLYDFVWDGMDAYDRPLEGTQQATIRTGYAYQAVYKTPAEFSQSFSGFGGAEITGVRARQEITIWQTSRTLLESASGWGGLRQGIGGWTLAANHSYDPTAETIHYGDGARRTTNPLQPVIKASVGTSEPGFAGDGGQAIQAQLAGPGSIAFAPGGMMYVADTFNHRIRRVDPDGIITTIAGTGLAGNTGDGGLAINARISQPNRLATGPDGSVYLISGVLVRRIAPDGIISTAAGNGSIGFSPDDIPALEANLTSMLGLAVGPDGSIYISDTGTWRVRRVSPDGILTTVAGNGIRGFSGDGGPAKNARLDFPWGLAVSLDGDLLIADNGNSRIRRVGADGIIRTVAGSAASVPGDGGPATSASLYDPNAVRYGPDGSFYISSNNGGSIRRVDSDGTITTIASRGDAGCLNQVDIPATLGGLCRPQDVAVDPLGRAFVADEALHRVVRVGGTMPEFGRSDLPIASADGGEVFQFDFAGRHKKTFDSRTGATVQEFSYADGLLSQIRDGDGNVVTIERDAAGRADAIVSQDGQRATLAFDANGWLASITNPGNEAHVMTYESDGLLRSFTNPRNFTSTFTYDIDGRLERDENAIGGFWSLDSEVAGRISTTVMSSAEGRSTSYRTERLPSGEVRRTNTFADGTTALRIERADGRLTDTLEDGTVVNMQRGPDPRFGMEAPFPASTSILLPSGLTSNISRQRTATLVDATNRMSLDRETTTIGVNGKAYTAVFDAPAGELVETSPEGRVTTTRVDQQGRVVFRQIAGLEPTSIGYDPRGRVTTIAQGTGTDRRTMTLVYGADGYVENISDAAGQSATYRRNAAGRVFEATFSGGRVFGLEYDRNGNVIAITPPGGAAHTFGYSEVDQEVRYEPPLAGMPLSRTLFGYNRDQQMTSVTRADGATVTYAYQPNGRMASIQPSGGSGDTVTLTYHPTSGKVVSSQTPSTTLAYVYDGFLETEETMTGEVAGVVGKTYNNDFRVSQVSVNGAGIAVGYDQDNLLTRAGDMTFARHPLHGLLAGTTIGTAVTSQGYTGIGELASFAATFNTTPIYSYSLGYDRAGRVTRRIEAEGGVSTQFDYGYDAAGRLESTKQNGIEVRRYGYDVNGNRTHLGGSLVATYDDQGRLSTYGTTTYAYGAYGELQQKTNGSAVTQYRYDVYGSLKQVTLPGGSTIDYVTDARNRRVGKKINGVLVQGFLYLDGLRVGAELDAGGSVVSRFVYGERANVPEYMVRGGITYRILVDQVGTVRLVLNVATGAIAQRLEYDEWGVVLADSSPGFQPFGFAGGLYEAATGLVRFGARDYDARTGRWTAKDPLRFRAGDANLYSYAFNDPLRLTDPTGLETCVMVTRDRFGVADHSAVSMSQGDKGKPAIYDPSGSFAREKDPGGGDIITGKDATPKNWSEFYKKLDGSTIEMVCKQTTKEEEMRLFEKASKEGGGFGASCARHVSNVLEGSKDFPKVTGDTFWPGNLLSDAKKK